ncbi:hypothetical protein TNCV_541031 [Trichonephila clavipes]|nr:hypothetical protein TNCV_541031 [Trichonephila clavipes]
MRCFPGVPSCEKYMIQACPVPACEIIEYLFACVRSAVFQIFKCQVPEFLCVLYKFEVRGRGTEKSNIFKVEEGKELNVYRSSDCEVKVGVCEGRVRAVAMGAQRVINPDNIGVALLN